MVWRILPHATACVCASRIYLLDIRQDRYFQVPPALAPETTAWLERKHACAPPPPVLALLRRSGIHRGTDDVPTNALKDRITIPDSLAPAGAASMQRNSHRAARRVLLSAMRLKLSSLHSILARRRPRPPLPITRDSGAALEIASRFDRSRVLVPIARDCLLDSLALDSLLERQGIGTQFVFGIAPRPFEAHCWLQTRDTILNDSYDHVSRFTPILAL